MKLYQHKPLVLMGVLLFDYSFDFSLIVWSHQKWRWKLKDRRISKVEKGWSNIENDEVPPQNMIYAFTRVEILFVFYGLFSFTGDKSETILLTASRKVDSSHSPPYTHKQERKTIIIIHHFFFSFLFFKILFLKRWKKVPIYYIYIFR